MRNIVTYCLPCADVHEMIVSGLISYDFWKCKVNFSLHLPACELKFKAICSPCKFQCLNYRGWRKYMLLS